MVFILKWRKVDGRFVCEDFDKMSELIERMEYLTANNVYFQVIHNIMQH